MSRRQPTRPISTYFEREDLIGNSAGTIARFQRVMREKIGGHSLVIEGRGVTLVAIAALNKMADTLTREGAWQSAA